MASPKLISGLSFPPTTHKKKNANPRRNGHRPFPTVYQGGMECTCIEPGQVLLRVMLRIKIHTAKEFRQAIHSRHALVPRHEAVEVSF